MEADVNQQALIRNALNRSNGSLNENEAKEILRQHGLPIVEETVATNVDEAVAAAESIGFPVVLKGLGSRLLHKTELGLVCTNLSSSHAVRRAAEHIFARGDDRLEGLLVQRHIRARRELMAGMVRDPQFGPVLMFGIGGVLTEALSDTTCRVLPISNDDAFDMMDSIRATTLLDAFRGEPAVDRQALADLLLRLADLALTTPEIAEIDLNPLLITSDGGVKVVDALVTCRTPQAHPDIDEPVAPADIRQLFYPRRIAFIGASAQFGKWGHMLYVNTVGGGFDGEVFLVNPRGGKIAGRQVYPRVADLPEGIDLAVVTIPARFVAGLIPQFEQKGIRNVLLITSGFGETGEEGVTLEKNLVKKARQAGILILGPNTMGICNPHIQFYCTGSPVRPIAGDTAVVAQSGNMGTQLLAFAEQQGIGIRGFAGSGNEAMLTIEDFLEGFEQDELTRTVMLYVESVKQGRRFFENARRVSRHKPIMLLKGGQSQAGNRAAASHTGAMASDSAVFNAMCRQAGIVKVDRPMELLDLSAAFSSLPLPESNRAAIMTLGGGWGVVTADLCNQNGIEVPPLDETVIARIDTMLPPYWSRTNPVDLVGENDLDLPMLVMEELLRWDGCDAVINLGILGRRIFVQRLTASAATADPDLSEDFLAAARQTLEAFEKTYVQRIAELCARYGKPVFGVSLLREDNDRTVYPVEGCSYNGVFYETPERAVLAFAKMVEYRRFLNREQVVRGNAMPVIDKSPARQA
jgi:acyl-CoA synthetase (NDP forming)